MRPHTHTHTHTHTYIHTYTHTSKYALKISPKTFRISTLVYILNMKRKNNKQ